MKNGCVSIIVPIYNVEDYLFRCLDSLINQTYRDLQIILVNDGSRDNSQNIIEEYLLKDSRIEAYVKENGGLSSARNLGLNYASGEYVMFVDSDDWIEKDLVRQCINAQRKYDSDIVCYGFFMEYENGNTVINCNSDSVLVLSREQSIDYLIEEKEIQSHACNKFFNSKLFDDIRFPVGKNYEDSYIMHNVFKRCKRVIHIGRPLYHYYMRFDSICNTPSKNNLLDMVGSHVQRYLDLENYISYNQKINVLRSIKKYYIKARRYLSVVELKEYSDWIKSVEKKMSNKSVNIIDVIYIYSTFSNFLIKIGYKIKELIFKCSLQK